jgi:hypothetical protein
MAKKSQINRDVRRKTLISRFAGNKPPHLSSLTLMPW